MKSTGIVRRVDELGRIVIPMEVRRYFGIDVKDPVEIFIDKNRIVLKKFLNGCVFCGKNSKLIDYKERKICLSCVQSLGRLE